MVQLPPPLDQIRPRLERAFGRRLRAVILYGSRARGDNRPTSDLDVMVVLDGPFRMHSDVGTTVDALYPVQLEVDYPIHASPVAAERFEREATEIFRRVKREGIPL